MATKPYLILHRRGDFDGQIAPFLLALNPLAWRLPNQQPRPNRASGAMGRACLFSIEAPSAVRAAFLEPSVTEKADIVEIDIARGR